jgi:hypothetical protein
MSALSIPGPSGNQQRYLEKSEILYIQNTYALSKQTQVKRGDAYTVVCSASDSQRNVFGGGDGVHSSGPISRDLFT